MARLVITISAFTLCVVVLLPSVGAVRYCSVCSMSRLVAQHLSGKGSYTQRRPIGRLDLREVCSSNDGGAATTSRGGGQRLSHSIRTTFGSQLQISASQQDSRGTRGVVMPQYKYLPVSTKLDRRHETTTNRKSVKTRSSEYIGGITTRYFDTKCSSSASILYRSIKKWE